MSATPKSQSANSTKTRPQKSEANGLADVFALLYGLFLGLTLLKFGTPVILDVMVESPTNIYEWILNSWPVNLGYWFLGAMSVLGLGTARWTTKAPRMMVALPLAWLGWQFLAGTQTVDAELTRSTLKHFLGCVVCFYTGLFALSRTRHPSLLWVGLLGGLLLVIESGMQQHFGGLEETRRYFYLSHPDLNGVPPEYLKRISSNRIFATFFYPNALAGALLLLLPGSMAVLWLSVGQRLTIAARGFLTGGLGLVTLACLYWSGSKGGWLLMLLLGLIVLLHLQFSQRMKTVLMAGILLAGLGGFFWKYSGFFHRGAAVAPGRGTLALLTFSSHSKTI